MTALELEQRFNDIICIHRELPDHLDVDHITYANVCQKVFDAHQEGIRLGDKLIQISVLIGINNGIMFKGVELILKENG